MSDTRFTDAPDFYPPHARARLQQHEEFLGRVLAQDHQGRWLMQQSNKFWTKFTKDAPALRAMVQHWGGHATPLNLNDKSIALFMREMAPVVRGYMPVPTSSAPAILFKGELYVNSWDASAVAQADAQAAEDPALQDILTKTLWMFRNNLCGGSHRLSIAKTLALAETDLEDELEWRFFMSFLAKPLQQVGHNMQVNMWLLGSINGLGRGTLTSQILPLIYGRHNVVELQAADVERGGWTDTLVGKLWVIINELNPGGGTFDWNSWIKANSCEGVLRIRQRNTDPYDALNFANWVFTSNQEEPRCLDAKDRRNALLQCNATMVEEDRKAACDLALEVAVWIDETQKRDPALVQRYIGALVHFLQQHRVDEQLLRYAPDTILKADVQEATSVDIKGLYWLQNDDSYPRDQVLPAHHYLDYYNRFASARGHMDGRGMGGVMAALSRRGLVKRHKPYKTKAAYWEVQSSLFPRATDVDEETKMRADAKVVSIAGLLPPAKRRG